MSDRVHALDVACPRCEASLHVRGRDGARSECPACGLDLRLEGDRILYDVAEALAARHDIQCPGCETDLSFHARDGARLACSACGLPLDVEAGRVLARRELPPSTPAQSKSAQAEPARLNASRRDELRRRFDQARGAVRPPHVRQVLAVAPLAIRPLAESGEPDVRGRAAVAEDLRLQLEDWWNERSDLAWPAVASIAAGLAHLAAPPIPGSTDGLRSLAEDAFIVDLAAEVVRTTPTAG